MARRTRVSIARTESSGAVTANATPAKTRRPHRKSRNGCAECKQRHIRCDERQPSCANCATAERTCSFLMPQADKQKHNQRQQYRAKQQQQQQQHEQAATTATSPSCEVPPPVFHLPVNQSNLDPASNPTHRSTPSTTGLNVNPHQIPSPAPPMQLDGVHTPPADCCPGLSTIPETVSKAIYTPQHMILMHHAATVPNFSRPNRSAIGVAIRHAVDSPYLLDEILAFTAFHMASLYPGSAVYLRHLAAELQNRGLASFTQLTKMVPHDDKATAVPRFLFSAILGRHVLADTLTHCSSDFDFFIDRFVECINLNRGIRTVTPPAWDHLYNSELQPFIRTVREAHDKIVSPGNDCAPLSRVMDDSDLNEASVKACRQAIEVLQWAFDLCRGLDEDDYPQSVSAFSVRIGPGFVDVLRKHRPEALIILAYYGVLLHRCRSFWAFGNAGASMIRAIAGRLGGYWKEALAWPLHVLEIERNSEPPTLAT